MAPPEKPRGTFTDQRLVLSTLSLKSSSMRVPVGRGAVEIAVGTGVLGGGDGVGEGVGFWATAAEQLTVPVFTLKLSNAKVAAVEFGRARKPTSPIRVGMVGTVVEATSLN